MMPAWANKAMVLCDKYDLPAPYPGDHNWEPKIFDLLHFMEKRLDYLERRIIDLGGDDTAGIFP